MFEIERKFLVKGSFKQDASQSFRIVQGYLNSDPERAVRVRIKGDTGYLTIKGKGDASGTKRFEWEKEIALADARELLEICEPGVIEKIRHIVPAGKHKFEVDVFYGENEGLILAEVELEDENETFGKPDWLGEEVTGDNRYYNSMLKQHPFSKWERQKPEV